MLTGGRGEQPQVWELGMDREPVWGEGAQGRAQWGDATLETGRALAGSLPWPGARFLMPGIAPQSSEKRSLIPTARASSKPTAPQYLGMA